MHLLLLDENAERDEFVLDLLECGEDRLPVVRDGLIVARFRPRDLCAPQSAVEQGLGRSRRDLPDLVCDRDRDGLRSDPAKEGV